MTADGGCDQAVVAAMLHLVMGADLALLTWGSLRSTQRHAAYWLPTGT
jgi:hypothetical protein